MTVLLIHQEHKKTQYFREPLTDKTSLEMILIPKGNFLMGSPPQEEGRQSSEGPQEDVTISQFFMGRYPITQAQWRAVVENTSGEQQLTPNPSYFEDDLRPVEKVSWFDAMEFCERLSQKTGRKYRLPTEAEWEYACRAGTTTPFHFGETITDKLANLNAVSTYGESKAGKYRGKTTRVNEFNHANAFGLSDMHGNVWEWCLDFWHDDYSEAPRDGSVWLTGGNENYRIVRGGSWHGSPQGCRCARRDGLSPDGADDNLGFRVVCEAPRTLA